MALVLQEQFPGTCHVPEPNGVVDSPGRDGFAVGGQGHRAQYPHRRTELPLLPTRGRVPDMDFSVALASGYQGLAVRGEHQVLYLAHFGLDTVVDLAGDGIPYKDSVCS